MHRLARRESCDAPGLTPLSGQYRRPDALWVCWQRANPLVTSLQDVDATGAEWYCTRADELELAAKLVYYGAKLLQVLKTVPPPLP